MNKLLFILLGFTWQLPQTLAAMIMFIYIKTKYPSKQNISYNRQRGVYYITHSWNRSFSLGLLVFIEQGETE